MITFILRILKIGIVGFLTEWLGLFLGGLASALIMNKEIKIKGVILGFLGGLTLGIVFFDLLPEAIEYGNIYLSIMGTTMGLILSFALDERLDNHGLLKSEGNNENFLKAAIFMAIAISFHNLPSGLALGSLLYCFPKTGVYLAIALILHELPEGLTLGVFFREEVKSRRKLLFISFIISMPMGIGAMIGSILNSTPFICICLSFSAAMMLYVTLRETLPTANSLWKGKLTTIGNVVGIILGMLLLTILEL